MPHHAIFIGRSKVPTCIQPMVYKYRPGRENEWTVREVPDGYVPSQYDDVTRYPIVDQYRKTVEKKPTPITPVKGSWYDTIKRKQGA